MKSSCLVVYWLWFLAAPCVAQVVIQVDFNSRQGDTNALTYMNFQSMVLDDVGGTMAAQTNVSTRTFDELSVSISGGMPTRIADDRLRATPTNVNTFTESLLLRDFVFGRDDGLDLSIEGLVSTQVYAVTLWSFDSGSGNNRRSDWSIDGELVVDNYTFNGSVVPTNNTRYQMLFEARPDGLGVLRLEGRYVSGTIGVFLNAFQLEAVPGTPVTFLVEPEGATRYEGERTTLSVEMTSPSPIRSVRWLLDGSPVPGATNVVLDIVETAVSNGGVYQCEVVNHAGAFLSAEATLTVVPTPSLDTALLGYWPLDEVNGLITPDAGPDGYGLTLTNMASSNLVSGQVVQALDFDGVDELLVRDITGESLRIDQHRSYTVALWVKGVGTGQADRRVFSQGNSTNEVPIFNIGTHSGGTDGTVDVYIRDNARQILGHTRSQRVAFDGEWHHIAWVDQDGSGQLYIDGVLDATSFNYVRSDTQFDVMSVGGIVRDVASHWFDGELDELYLWGRGLTATEVTEVAGIVRVPPKVDAISRVGNDLVFSIRTPDTGAVHRLEVMTNQFDGVWAPVPGATFSPTETNSIQTVTPVLPEPRAIYRIGVDF